MTDAVRAIGEKPLPTQSIVALNFANRLPVPSQLRGVLKYTWSIPKIYLSSFKNISKYLISNACWNDDVEGFVNVWHFIDTKAEIRWRWYCDHNHHHDHWDYDDDHHDGGDSNDHDWDGLMITMILQVCGIVCIQSLWSQWREEKSIFRSLHELSMVRLEKDKKTLPKAQRTQGIEPLIFSGPINKSWSNFNFRLFGKGRKIHKKCDVKKSL